METQVNNIFCTCTIQVHSIPASLNTESMCGEDVVRDAIDKVDHFFHKRLGVPVSWLVCSRSLEIYAAEFLTFKNTYGDEFGIYEPCLYGKEIAEDTVQTWMDELGLERPSVPGWPGIRLWSQVDEKTQIKIISFLKSKFDATLLQDTKLMYAACGDAKTVRAMKHCGIELLWGYNWNLYGDFVDATGKGCPINPFYVNSKNIKAPAEAGDCSLLGVPWGSGDLLNNYCIARTAKVAMNNVCLNAHELANRSGDVPEYEFVEKAIAQLSEQAKWNPFAYIPLQIEAHWIDEGSVFYKQHPNFNSHTTEVFFHEVEAAVRNGAKVVTHYDFLQWYREHFKTTPKMINYFEDLVEDVAFRGKDQNFAPMAVYSDDQRQTIFLRSAGFNQVRTYDYSDVPEVDDPGMEYPFESEPNVELKVKAWTTPAAGVTLTQEKAYYSIEEFDLTSYEDLPDYACAYWEANVPEYISPTELTCSLNISRVELIGEKNLALIFADLAKGDNKLQIHSDMPNDYLSIDEQRFAGRRFEIYIKNTGPAVKLSKLETMLEPNLQIGGFWWAGKYYRSINNFHHSWYDWHTGTIELKAAYPMAYHVRRGITRCSFEIVGKI